MAQINLKNLGLFMGYRGEVETRSGAYFEGAKKIRNSGSKYSAGGGSATATIGTTALKALLLYKGEEVNGTVGCCAYDSKKKIGVAEIKSEYNGRTSIDIATYTQAGGGVNAVTYYPDDGSYEKITLGHRYGTAVMLAMLPTILQDYEAFDIADTPTMSLTEEQAARFSDNIYFRLKNSSLKMLVPSTGVFPVLTDVQINSGAYAATGTIYGKKNFEILVAVGATGKRIRPSMKKEEFLTSFVLNKARKLGKREGKLVPSVPDWYIIPEEAERSCRIISKSTGKNRPVRNVLLKGPAGTGKTLTSRAIAAGLNLPYTHQTCDAGMELFNLIGTILPATEGKETMSAEELAEKMDLPSVEEIQFDFEDAYRRLEGLGPSDELPKGLSEMEVVNLLFKKQMEIIKSIAGRGQEGKDFVYVPSELIKAVKYGWVCEVQEPTVIIQPGVLPGLNSLLEGGSISLPTGEIVERHPDSVIIFTTNTDYEGCRALNESVLDRFPLKFLVDLPDDDVLIERAKKVTGSADDDLIRKCLTVLDEARTYLLSQGEGIGNVGPRTLYDWIDAAEIEGSAIDAAEYTLLTSATDDEEIKDYLREQILYNVFTE